MRFNDQRSVMNVSTKLMALLAFGGMFGFVPVAAAQCPAAPDPGAIKSNGIEGAIVSAIGNPRDKRLALTIELHNITNNVAYILTVGNLQISTNAGASLVHTGGDSNINLCVRSALDKENASDCMSREADSINSYNVVGPCEKIRGTMYFLNQSSSDLKPGETLNYSYRGMVRFRPDNPDPLLADKPPGPVHTVVLNFPPITIRYPGG